MPVYNAEKYLREAIDSILNQTYTDFELIAIDDGSTDNSLKILREYEKQDERIRVISETRCGVAKVRNIAIAVAKGEFIANMDADDISSATRFDKQIAYMNANPECVALGAQVEFIDSDGEPVWNFPQPLTHEEIESLLWRGRGLTLTQSVAMMRRHAVLNVGCYDESLKTSEDLDLYLKLAEVGKLSNLPDTLFQVRRHYKSISALGAETDGAKRRLKVLQKAAKRRSLNIDIKLDEFPMPRTRAEWHADTAWRAYKHDYIVGARKHALLAVKYGPLEYLAWRSFLYLRTRLGRKILIRRSKTP